MQELVSCEFVLYVMSQVRTGPDHMDCEHIAIIDKRTICLQIDAYT